MHIELSIGDNSGIELSEVVFFSCIFVGIAAYSVVFVTLTNKFSSSSNRVVVKVFPVVYAQAWGEVLNPLRNPSSHLNSSNP